MMGVGYSRVSGFSTTADGLWVCVEESYYCSGLAEASLFNLLKSEDVKGFECSGEPEYVFNSCLM